MLASRGRAASMHSMDMSEVWNIKVDGHSAMGGYKLMY